MHKPSKSAGRLAQMINKAIDDGKLTNAEHVEIFTSKVALRRSPR